MSNPITTVKETKSTQVEFPWRTTIRTIIQVGPVALAAAVSAILVITDGLKDYLAPEVVVWLLSAAGFLTVASATFARIMAIPGVDEWLNKFGLASTPKNVNTIVEYVSDEEALADTFVAPPKIVIPEIPQKREPRG